MKNEETGDIMLSIGWIVFPNSKSYIQ